MHYILIFKNVCKYQIPRPICTFRTYYYQEALWKKKKQSQLQNVTNFIQFVHTALYTNPSHSKNFTTAAMHL